MIALVMFLLIVVAIVYSINYGIEEGERIALERLKRDENEEIDV